MFQADFLLNAKDVLVIKIEKDSLESVCGVQCEEETS